MRRKDAVREAFERGEVFDAHRRYGKRFFFSTEDLDFGFTYFLGTLVHGGVELGEMLHIASRVNEKKLDTFVEEILALAGRVEARARQSLSRGHVISGREGLLRASNYARIANALVNPRHQLELWKDLCHRSRRIFREAAALFDPAIETLEIPFEGTVLPGYFLRPEKDSKRRKTLLMIGGGETFAEDQYFYVAPAAIRRGYNFMTVDLPGQGSLPLEGKFFRSDNEVPIRVVVDYALSRPDVDAERLAVYGISAGGYLVPRACAYEKRIRACIANSMLYDLDRIFRGCFLQFGELFKKRDPLSWLMADLLAWRWGGKNPLDLIPLNRDFKFDPALISCPTLLLIGEGEYAGSKETQRQNQTCMGVIANPQVKLVIAPHDEGAGHHCLGENLSLMSQIVFDWLDEVFA